MRVPTAAPILPLILFAHVGCATTGEIPVQLDESEVLYISPANADGIRDTVSYSLSAASLERTSLARYELTVTAPGGEVTYNEVVEYPASGLRDRLRGPSETAEIVVWDGRNDRGEFVADGEYALSVQVWDNRDNSGTAAARRVVVDNTAPSATLSADSLIFSPDGDSRQRQA